MSTRRSITDYTGASGKLAIEKVGKLDPRRYAVQVKHDGCFAQVHTDRHGRIERILSRTGEELGQAVTGDIMGCLVSAPHSVLHAELTAMTEAGRREAQALGHTQLHVFDAIRVGGTYLAREPYRTRRDWLMRAHAEAQLQSPDNGKPWTFDQQGRAHKRSNGRYMAPTPRDWRRATPVEMLPLSAAGDLWERAQVGEIEGLVVVALDAPVGRKGSKRKVKPTDGIECVVVEVDARRAGLYWAAAQLHFVCGRGGHDLSAGQVVEVTSNGFYDTGLPKFPRIARIRSDLASQ
jgi:ATP-dependent DNA ligase